MSDSEAATQARAVSPILAVSTIDRLGHGGHNGSRQPRSRVAFAETSGRRDSIEYEPALDRSFHTGQSTTPESVHVISMPVQGPMTWTAQVVGHEIARDEKDNTPFAVYVVEARLNDEVYVVKRRFQAFMELKKQVRRRVWA